MKRLVLGIVILVIAQAGFSQVKNFIDQPYLETSAKVDTMVTPDKIYLSIDINEGDSKNKVSVDELENRLAGLLKKLDVDVEKQLTLTDLSSNFKNYFLKRNNILKHKNYQLVVFNAVTAGRVIAGLEDIGISNVNLLKTEYSKIDELNLILKGKAVAKAKMQAEAMLKPLNQRVGAAIFIVDGYSNANSYLGIRADVMAAPRSKEAFEPINIDFEKITVESSVSVKFKIE